MRTAGPTVVARSVMMILSAIKEVLLLPLWTTPTILDNTEPQKKQGHPRLYPEKQQTEIVN